jgi:hypothetical protein
MRTSLNNIKTIDDYLLGHMTPEDAQLFKVKVLLNSDLSDELEHQQMAYSIIKKYSRQHLKAEIKAVQEKLATAAEHMDFMHRITYLFKIN